MEATSYVEKIDTTGAFGREQATEVIYILAFASAFQVKFGTCWMSMEDLTLPLAGLAGHKNKVVIERVRELLVAGFLESDLLGAGYCVRDVNAVAAWVAADLTRAKMLEELTTPVGDARDWTSVDCWLNVIAEQK